MDSQKLLSKSENYLFIYLFITIYGQKRPDDNLQRSLEPHIRTDHLWSNINTLKIINSRNAFMIGKNT